MTPSAPKTTDRWQPGVRHKLYLSLVLINILVLVMGVTAINAFRNSASTMRLITDDMMPVTETVAEVIALNSKLNALIPTLVFVQSHEELDEINERLNSLLEQRNRRLLEFRSFASEEQQAQVAVVENIERLNTQMIRQLEDFKRDASGLIRIIDQQKVNSDTLMAAHTDFIISASPVSDDAQFELIIGLEENADTAQLAEQAEILALAMDVKAEGNLLAGILETGIHLEFIEEIAPFAERYDSSINRLNSFLKRFPEDREELTRIRAATAVMSALGDRTKGVFHLQQTLLESKNRLKQEVAELEALSDELTGLINDLTQQVKNDVSGLKSVTESTLETGVITMIAAFVFSVLFTILVSWLFISRRIIKPIDDLKNIMLSLTAKDFSQPIHSTGSQDEIGQMANAVSVFRDSMMENDSLNAELQDAIENAEMAQKRAEEANRTKSAFLANMSHEIRTPMNGIVGMLDTLSYDELNDDQIDALKTIKSSSFILLNLIDDILDFSKIEAGHMTIERIAVDLTDLVEQVATSLELHAEKKRVRLNVFIDPALPSFIYTDKVRMTQVLYNLIGNAIKFSAGRDEIAGEVNVRVTPDPASTTAPGVSQGICFDIQDNGIGIKAETIPKLFNSFSQAESSTTRKFGGTGLGLSISKRIVDLLGGDIHVISEEGAGALFRVSLPCEAAPAERELAQPELQRVTCYVQEQAGSLSDDIRLYLEAAGAQVVTFAQPETLPEANHNLQVVVIPDWQPSDTWPQTDADNPDSRRYLCLRRGRKGSLVFEGNRVTAAVHVLRRDYLLNAVAIAAGLSSPAGLGEADVATDAGVRKEAPTIAEARQQGTLILVAEDDPTNRKVILLQLNSLGYAAEFAEDGQQALTLWREGEYALLLSDLHMPELDGYGLAREVRKAEAAADNATRMPILALTANALHGERQNAVEAGMDDYITKPVQIRVLEDVLKKWMPEHAGHEGVVAMPDNPPESDNQIFDVSVMKQVLGDDPDFLQELLDDYLEALMTSQRDLTQAFSQGDLPAVSGIAHKLKSSSRSVGAVKLGDLCAELEVACNKEKKCEVEALMADSETMIEKVDRRIRHYLRKMSGF